MKQKIKFHWINNKKLLVDEIAELSTILDNYGFESLLLTFTEREADYWIKAARALFIGQKIKYMIALRPYAINPTYALMMAKAFEQIDKDRLMLNIIAGINDFEADRFNVKLNVEERKQLCSSFLKKMISANESNWDIDTEYKMSKFPDIVVSGSSPEMIECTNKYGDISLTTLNNYMLYLKDKNILENKRKMVRCWILLCDSEADAKIEYNKIKDEREKTSTIFGDKEMIKSKIMELQSFGITDILLSCNRNIQNEKDVQLFIGKLIKENV
jgi:alkanesulfonate monooxygenase SsuD/methylene tetrahydromethanopterin reductase-like flavin-dependent oxidoreductase (luciferase family)